MVFYIALGLLLGVNMLIVGAPKINPRLPYLEDDLTF